MIMLSCGSRTSQTMHLYITLPYRADQAHVVFSLHNSRVVSYVNELVYTSWKGCVRPSDAGLLHLHAGWRNRAEQVSHTSLGSRRSYSAAMLGDVVLANEVQMTDRAATVYDATTSPRKRSDDGTCAVTT